MFTLNILQLFQLLGFGVWGGRTPALPPGGPMSSPSPVARCQVTPMSVMWRAEWGAELHFLVFGPSVSLNFCLERRQGGGRTSIVYHMAQVLTARALLPPTCGATSGGEGSGIRLDNSACFPALPGVWGWNSLVESPLSFVCPMLPERSPL